MSVRGLQSLVEDVQYCKVLWGRMQNEKGMSD